MVSSAATTVEQYLTSLPADRRSAIERVRDTVNAHLPAGYEEGMQYGMISWYVPFSRLSATHNGQPLAYAALAAQKTKSSLYLMTVYGNKELEKRFRAGFAAAGKKLDMGKSCVRFTRADDLALDAVADAVAAVSVDAYVAHYQKTYAETKTGQRKAKAAAKAKPARKKAAVKKPAAKAKPAAKTKPAAKRR